MALDSTRAIIALWRLCVPAGLGPQVGQQNLRGCLIQQSVLKHVAEVGGDGAIPVDVLKAAQVEAASKRVACFSADCRWYWSGSCRDTWVTLDTAPSMRSCTGLVTLWLRLYVESILAEPGPRQTYMQPDSEGVVGFLQFWKGMEDGGVAQAMAQGRSSFAGNPPCSGGTAQHSVAGAGRHRNGTQTGPRQMCWTCYE